jgi:gamma-glutamylcyclotransferase (GGCT)/AIG2-like uncharacterized protein YtfP
MPLYFAYGVNMDIAEMAKRAPNSRPLGPARLPRHRFIIMKEGYASILRDPRWAVHGLLWDLALADLRPLDKFEGVERGLYTKINQPVIVTGGAKRALVYVGCSAEPGKPRPGYLEGILAAGRDIALPAAYLRELEGWSGRPVEGPTGGGLAKEGAIKGVRPRFLRPT